MPFQPGAAGEAATLGAFGHTAPSTVPSAGSGGQNGDVKEE